MHQLTAHTTATNSRSVLGMADIRAFNLVSDTPVREVGWGQWSKPAMPMHDNGDTALDVCGINPHGLTCPDGQDRHRHCRSHDHLLSCL